MTTPPERRRASISDVARHAGVAVGTVSNYLNNPEKVSPATREKVAAAVAHLRFVRNAAARQLRAGDLTTVGAIMLDIRNPFFTEVARGIEDRLAEVDHTLMLADSDEDPAREARYRRLFEEQGVAGLLVVPTGRDLSPYLELQERGVRVVLVDARSDEPSISSVAVDDVAGGRLAAAHLLERGHREIVLLNGPEEVRQAVDRRRGVDLAVRAAGLDPASVVREVVLPTLDATGGDDALVALHAEDGAVPRAIFCVNDLVAIGVQRALRRLGGSALLHEVDVVGYDDIEVARELAVPLTSVRQRAYEVGARAAEILLAEGRGPEHVVFVPELVVRESSGGGSGSDR